MTVDIPKATIRDFCSRWRIKQLAVFGSALGDEFRPDSDIDILVVLRDDARWGLFDHQRAEDELSGLLGRKVDLVNKAGLRNPFRRHHILNHHRIVYEG